MEFYRVDPTRAKMVVLWDTELSEKRAKDRFFR